MENFNVLAIKRHCFGTDGNGITSLIALSNCPLKCKYCLNKEVIKMNDYIVFTPIELLDEIMIDYCYFFATNGGVTFGGAEPLLYSSSIKEFIKIIPNNININIETSLNVSNELLKIIAKDISLFIIDIKSMDKDIYKNYINSSNNRIIYVNQTLETSECLKNDFLSLCGFSFIDLREANDCYIKIEKYLTFQMLGLVVMLVLICVSNINLKTKNFINNSKKQKIKSIYITLAIFVGYFFCCVLLSYLIYSLLIETSVYYKYTIPILEILLSFMPLVMFVNIKPQSTTN